MSRTRLSDLPPHVRERVLRQMGRDPAAPAPTPEKPAGKARKAPTTTPPDPALLEAAGRARAFLTTRERVPPRGLPLPGSALHLTIPGEPRSQARARFQVRKMRRPDGSTFMRPVPEDDPSSAAWKAAVAVLMEAARVQAGWDGPIGEGVAFRVTVLAVWPCLESRKRKRTPAEPRWKASKPDADNVAKAVLDAGNGVLWRDDAACVVLEVQKREAGQADTAYGTTVFVRVEENGPA